MSWSSGSEIFTGLIDVLKDKVDDLPLREEIYQVMIPLFEEQDCDTLYECVGADKAFDNVYTRLYPETQLDEEDNPYYDDETGDWIIPSDDE